MSVGKFERFGKARILDREQVALTEELQETKSKDSHHREQRKDAGDQSAEGKTARRILGDDDDEEVEELHEQNPRSAENNAAILLQALEQQRHKHEEEAPKDEKPVQPVPTARIAYPEVE